MSKKLVGIVSVIVIVALGVFFWIDSSKVPQVAVQDAPAVTSVAGPITAAMVAEHSTVAGCWTIIDGGVYDLTAWIPLHPGGERAIAGLCGKDGTAAFHGQHDDAKQQADILATFKIGSVTP